MKPQVFIAIVGVLSVALMIIGQSRVPRRVDNASATVRAESSLNTVIGRDSALTGKSKEPECVFDPPTSTNAINAPCYAVITAIATDDKGATAVSAPVVIHFKPRRQCGRGWCPD